MTLAYDESLDDDAKPAPGDFAVTVDSEARSVTAVAISNTEVALTLASEVTPVQTVALGYTPGTHPIRDLAQNPAGSLSNLAVANRTPIVCIRTAQVRDEIVRQAPVSSCGEMTLEHLAEIRELSLSSANIRTLKSADFIGLTALEALDLSDNSLTAVPADLFSGLTALQDLYLDGNDLGSLDAGLFSGLTALISLDLSDNSLTTLPAGLFSRLTALQELNLDDNDVSGLGANSFSGLTELTDLLLSGNRLGSLDAGLFSGLTALTHLEMTDAGVTGLPSNVFSGLSALKTLSLDDNDLGALYASLFSGLTALVFLDLTDAGITSLPSMAFLGLSALKRLDLDNNDLGSLDVGLFSGLTALEGLDLSHSQVTAVPENLFSGLTALKGLDLSDNDFSSVDADLLSAATELTVLSLSGNNLTTLPATLFSGQAELSWLYLRGNDLSTLPDGLFSGLTKLTRLRLEGNTVDPLPIGVSLETVGSRFRAEAHTAATFEMVLPLRLANGEIDTGEESIAIPQGDVESEFLSISRTAGTTAAVTVDIGMLPALPASDSGYVIVKSEDLPLEAIAAEPGVEIYPAELTMPEDDSDVYTVSLTSEPTADVTVTVTVPSGADVTVDPSPLFFTDQDWFTRQTVTVSSSADADTDDDEVTLTHTVSGGYQGVTAADVLVTVTETDVTANSAPVFATTSFDVKENETEVGALVATDADARDYVTGYAITGGTDQAHFEITDRGALTFVEIPDYERPAGSSNRYAIDVTATSGMGTRERTRHQRIIVSVTDVEEPPGPPGPPVLDLPLRDPHVEVTQSRRRPANTGPDITSWQIQYRVKDSGDDFIGYTPDPEPDWTQPDWGVLIRDLNRDTTYEVQVAAKNDEGGGAWSPAAEIEIPNESPVVAGAIDDVTLPVRGAVEVVSVDQAFNDPDDDALDFSALSTNTAVATVQVSGGEVLVHPGAAGTTTINLTASDPWGESASATFSADVRTPTLSAPTLNIAGNIFTLAFTDDFAADETRAYEVRVRQTDPIGTWATGCFSKTNNRDSPKSLKVTVQDLVSGFFEPGSTYEADYGYVGADCSGSLSGVRSSVAEATLPGTPAFNIDVVYAGSAPDLRFQAAIETAVQRWQLIITGDIPNHNLSSSGRRLLERTYPGTTAPNTVDDLVLYVEILRIDGPGGIQGPARKLLWRSPSVLPIAAGVKLDREDIRTMTDQELRALVLHEIAHTLGFGLPTWNELDLLNNHSLDRRGRPIWPIPDTYFDGSNAISAFNAAGGSGYKGEKVPVENSWGGAGSQDAHWRESVLQHEVMTPTVGTATFEPLSAITIQSLADLGYTVDVTQADAYTVPSTPASRIATESKGLILQDCVVIHPEAGPDKPEPIMLNLLEVTDGESQE